MTNTRMLVALKIFEGCHITLDMLKFRCEQQVLVNLCAIEYRTIDHMEKSVLTMANFACNATTGGARKPSDPMLWFLHWEIGTELNLIISYANVMSWRVASHS